MFLTIHKSIPILSIQQQFSEVYPLLKIEFFRFPQRKQPLSENLIIGPIHSMRLTDSCNCTWKINIAKKRTLREVEKDLELLFGLFILVYRKAGDRWLETFLTDDWTLQQQQAEAEKKAQKICMLNIRQEKYTGSINAIRF